MIIEKIVELVFSFIIGIFTKLGQIPVLNIPSWSVDFDYFMKIALIFFPPDVFITLMTVFIGWSTYSVFYWLIMWVLKKIPLINVE